MPNTRLAVWDAHTSTPTSTHTHARTHITVFVVYVHLRQVAVVLLQCATMILVIRRRGKTNDRNLLRQSFGGHGSYKASCG